MKALAIYLKGDKKDEVTNQFLYASLAQLYEEMGNEAEAIRVNEQLLAYFQKMGSAFDMYAQRTRDDLTRLRAKGEKSEPRRCLGGPADQVVAGGAAGGADRRRIR